MLTKTYIKTNERKTEYLLLAPLCVAFEHRKKGIGATLVNYALNKARDLGYKAVFLCGDPEYYCKFGFISVSNYDIKYTMDIPGKYVLACELRPGILKNEKGVIDII